MESYRLPPLPPKPCPIISLQKHRGAGPSSILRSLSAVSHLPYTLPSSVSCKSFACHFYANSASRTVLRDENRRRVHQQFPFRNLRLSTHHFTELLSFHTLAHSFAPRKKSTLLFSIHSALFVKNTRVGEGSMLTTGPSSERARFFRRSAFSRFVSVSSVFSPHSVLLILKFVVRRAKMLSSVAIPSDVWVICFWLRLRRAVLNRCFSLDLNCRLSTLPPLPPLRPFASPNRSARIRMETP